MSKRSRQPVLCHPDRPRVAKGLCKACYDKGYIARNKNKVLKRSKEWFQANSKRVLSIRRRYLYGLEPDRYMAIWCAQDGVCKICQKEPATHVDHNHLTKEVRGLLCGNCNRGLGLFKEDPTRLATAIKYLELYNT